VAQLRREVAQASAGLNNVHAVLDQQRSRHAEQVRGKREKCDDGRKTV
jgi:hypothetical protein